MLIARVLHPDTDVSEMATCPGLGFGSGKVRERTIETSGHSLFRQFKVLHLLHEAAHVIGDQAFEEVQHGPVRFFESLLHSGEIQAFIGLA